MKFLNTEETTLESAQDCQATVVSEGMKIVEDQGWGEDYPELAAQLESADPQEAYKAGYTAQLMHNQAVFMENAVRTMGEATVGLVA